MKITFLDPMARDYRGRENEPGIDDAIVSGDMEDIQAADLIIANCPQPSYGTAMEIFYASRDLDKPVLVICPSDRPSPWLTRWAYLVVKTVEQAQVALRGLVSEGSSVYLAGPINGCTDAQCIDWRESFKRAFAES